MTSPMLDHHSVEESGAGTLWITDRFAPGSRGEGGERARRSIDGRSSSALSHS